MTTPSVNVPLRTDTSLYGDGMAYSCRRVQTCRNPRCQVRQTAVDGAPCRACGYRLEVSVLLDDGVSLESNE